MAAPDRFDLAVIGAGAAGLSVAYGAARFGRRVALIEQATMGGECLNTGCVPSKALLQAARGGLAWPAAQQRIQATIAAIAPADSAARYTALGATVIKGQAHFTGPGALHAGGRDILARRIVIAIGSRPKIPQFCHALPYWTNETIWTMPACPAHLLIIGGGPMGFEMAQAFAGLGAKVTLCGRLLPGEDPELAAPLVAALRAQGITLLAQRVVAARPGPVLELADGQQISGSDLLIAAGRMVDGAPLAPQAAGIGCDADGFPTDTGLRVAGGKGRIFAAGDCANPAGASLGRATSLAGVHAGIILRRAIFRLPASLPASPPARAIFTAPELAQVGLSLAQAGPGARPLLCDFADNDRAVAENNTTGLVKLVLGKNGRLIGAGITGPHAGEMIGLYALAIAQNLKPAAIAGLTLPYPTRAEAGKRAVSTLLADRLFSKWPRRLAAWLARWG